MKPTARLLPWVVALVVAFLVAKYPFIQSELFPYFPGAWLQDGRNWLSNQGSHRVAGYYGLIMVHGPDLILALMAGALCTVVISMRGILLVIVFVLSYKFFEGICTTLPYSGAELVQIEVISTLIVLPAGLIGGLFGMLIRKQWPSARQVNQCRNCRYDLTGNISGVCPECGTKVETNPDAGN